MNDKNKLRVAIYLRLSNEDKNKENINENSESIKNQRNMLIDYINKNPNFTLTKEYCDEDLSGAGTYRPAFEKLINDCEKGKIDIVLCKSQSRFSRDMEIIEKYINNKFKEWNIRFIGISDNADTDNYGNKKARQINGLVNEWFLEDISNNIRSAFYAKMTQGEYISPFAAYGYEICSTNNNQLIIDPIASKNIKKIFNLYLTGMGLTKIAQTLNNENIPSPSFYKYQKGIKLNIVSNKPRNEIKWNANTIKTILTNELYIGNLIQGKRTTISYKNHKIIKKAKDKWIRCENTHEQIIDKETFKKVNTILNNRKKIRKNNGFVHNLSGKIFCLECKRCMHKKNSNKHQYLVCYNSEIHNCQNAKSIRYDQIEKILLKEINKKINKYIDKDIIEKNLNVKINSAQKDILKKLSLEKNEILKMKKKNINYLENLYKDKIDGIINNKQFEKLKIYFTKEEKIYDKQLNDINDKIKYNKQKSNINNNIINKYYPIKKINRYIIEEFIYKIYISKIDIEKNTRNIKIIWNF